MVSTRATTSASEGHRAKRRIVQEVGRAGAVPGSNTWRDSSNCSRTPVARSSRSSARPVALEAAPDPRQALERRSARGSRHIDVAGHIPEPAARRRTRRYLRVDGTTRSRAAGTRQRRSIKAADRRRLAGTAERLQHDGKEQNFEATASRSAARFALLQRGATLAWADASAQAALARTLAEGGREDRRAAKIEHHKISIKSGWTQKDRVWDQPPIWKGITMPSSVHEGVGILPPQNTGEASVNRQQLELSVYFESASAHGACHPPPQGESTAHAPVATARRGVRSRTMSPVVGIVTMRGF